MFIVNIIDHLLRRNVFYKMLLSAPLLFEFNRRVKTIPEDFHHHPHLEISRLEMDRRVAHNLFLCHSEMKTLEKEYLKRYNFVYKNVHQKTIAYIF